MIRAFLRSPLPNTLAIVVLVALIITWITSLILSMRDKPIDSNRGWYAVLLPAFSLLGIPAFTDLLQTSGIALAFALVVFVVFLLNIFMPILKTSGRSSSAFVRDWNKWAILISAIGGLAVVGYLTFIESTGGPVACGPSGGCDTVQHSKYSMLFGVLHVGQLGVAGYVAILVAWLAWQFGPQALRKTAVLALWGMCIFGVLFSIYLTTLEPFVIGATCMWCVSSAVLMMLMLLASTPSAQQALSADDEDDVESDLLGDPEHAD